MIQVLAGLSVLALVPLATQAVNLTELFSNRAGFRGPGHVVGSVLAAALVMLGPAIVMGMVFPMGSGLLVDHLSHAGRRVGMAYLANTTGSVLGSLVTGFFLIPTLSLKGSLMLLATLQVAAGWLLLARTIEGGRRAVGALATGATLGAALLGLGVRLRGPTRSRDCRMQWWWTPTRMG